MKTFKIAHLFYDLMNLYGENGNIRYLEKKLEEQNIKTEIHFLSLEDKIDYDKYDLYYIGTGSEDNLKLIIENMSKQKEDIKKAIDNNKYFIVTGNAIEVFAKNNLNIFEYEIINEEFRIVGEQYYKSNNLDKIIVGFQNRNTSIINCKDNIFEIIKGTGYNPNSKYEGIKRNNFFGTYLLGPILVRNPYLCDEIIKEICKNIKQDYKETNKEEYAYKAYEEYLKNFYYTQK